MIERLESNLGSFKSLVFSKGLNVVLAQKSVGATDRQTRNGAGKSSLVELVHFLLGGSYGTDHFLRAPALADSWYGMRFDLAGQRVEVQRTPAMAKEIVIAHADVTSWPRPPKLNKKSNQLVISNTDWKVVLGNQMFGLLDADDGENENEDESPLFGPTFRMLFPYFARRQAGGGFLSPQQHSNKQQPWDQQVSVTHLLGLDPSVPQALQLVRQREKALGELRKAAKGGLLGDVIGKASDLRTKLTVQDAKVAKLREQLATFQVVPQYREYEQEASRLGVEISKLANDNTADEQSIQQLNEAAETETPPRFADVKRAYDEAGVALPGLVQKRFEDVERFHKSIVENRKSHLRSEIEAAQQRIRVREQAKQGHGSRRAELMMILKTGGALDHFSQLQSELSRQEAQAESLR
ncbi:MAG: DUF2326 domain-containing protein, partial [Gemmatimonadaceae bacterium]|nr:DUF2326 domain-containing protein [Gemmatimonadaceae bacterium]